MKTGDQVIYTPDWGSEWLATVLGDLSDVERRVPIQLEARRDGVKSDSVGQQLYAPPRCLLLASEVLW